MMQLKLEIAFQLHHTQGQMCHKLYRNFGHYCQLPMLLLTSTKTNLARKNGNIIFRCKKISFASGLMRDATEIRSLISVASHIRLDASQVLS